MILIADSGSTKADWWLAEGGRALRCMATQGINPYHQDEGEISSIVMGELLPQMGNAEPGRVYFYGSGCRAEVAGVVESALRRAFAGAERIEAQGDLLGAARAVCGRSEGVACILGTGSNSCLYDGEAIVANTPPLGYILGDEGSGAVLGREFLNALFKGRLPECLRREFESWSGLTMADVIRRVYREPLANRFLASLSPFIHAHLSCQELRAMVIGCFRSFLRNNVTCYRRPDLPLGIVGSVGYHYREELAEAARAEGMSLGVTMRSPMEGLLRYHGGEG